MSKDVYFLMIEWQKRICWRYTVDKETAIKLFEDKRVRVLWDEEQEKWFFSIIDVVEVLSGTDRKAVYF
jgi:hypothetical protein